MIVSRAPGWEQRLAAEVTARSQRAFAWGGHDCATWPIAALQAVAGVDARVVLGLGKWTTAIGAARVWRRLGGTYEAAMAAAFDALELPEIDPGHGRRGDLALIPHDEEAWGVCCVVLWPAGRRWGLAVGADQAGLTAVQVSRHARVWRV